MLTSGHKQQWQWCVWGVLLQWSWWDASQKYNWPPTGCSKDLWMIEETLEGDGAAVIMCLHFRYSCQNSKLSYRRHKHCRQHRAEILNHFLFLSLSVLAVWVPGPAVMLIPTPTSLLFLGCVIRCVLVAAGERLALWNFNNGELVPSFPFAACFGRAAECQWDIRVEAGWIGSGCGRRDLGGLRALCTVRSVHVGSQKRRSVRHSLS